MSHDWWIEDLSYFIEVEIQKHLLILQQLLRLLYLDSMS